MKVRVTVSLLLVEAILLPLVTGVVILAVPWALTAILIHWTFTDDRSPPGPGSTSD